MGKAGIGSLAALVELLDIRVFLSLKNDDERVSLVLWVV